MSKPTYEQLEEMAAHYEFTLARIADKPREYRELVAHEGGKPKGLTPGDAYRKCGNIAFMALKLFIPDIRESDLKKMDFEGRKARGLEMPTPKATRKRAAKKATAKARAPRAKGGGRG
jgi:hypothetical protein